MLVVKTQKRLEFIDAFFAAARAADADKNAVIFKAVQHDFATNAL